LKTLYYRSASGALTTITGDDSIEVPEDATELTEEEYLAAIAQLEADQEAALEAERVALAQKQLADFTALVNLGIPVNLARSLSGYTGPWPLPTP
jgi:hypothetical protein